MGMNLFPGKYTAFRLAFAQSTGSVWKLDRHRELPEGRGWLIKMQLVNDWWLITADPSVMPHSTPGVTLSPHDKLVRVIRWGTARLRAWRCTVDEASLSGPSRAPRVRDYFPNAILPAPIDRKHLWVVQ